MLRCAFLTLDNSSGFVIDDELAYPPLAALGWRVEAISWRTTPGDWRAYDAVVIRSTWDYIADPDAGLNRRSRKRRSRDQASGRAERARSLPFFAAISASEKGVFIAGW